MADDLEELGVRPDIGLQRRDVEVADQDLRPVMRPLRGEPDGHVVDEFQLVGEFVVCDRVRNVRSEEHTSELQSLMRISYAVFCLKKKIILRTLLQYTTQMTDKKI